MTGSGRARPGSGDRVRVGTAGWSYREWHGIVYPAPLPHRFRENAGRDARYDYLYTAEKLAPWLRGFTGRVATA